MGRGGHVTNGERRTAAAEVAGAGSREAGAVVMQYEGDSRSAVPGSRNPIAVHLDYGVMYAVCACVCVCVCGCVCGCALRRVESTRCVASCPRKDNGWMDGWIDRYRYGRVMRLCLCICVSTRILLVCVLATEIQHVFAVYMTFSSRPPPTRTHTQAWQLQLPSGGWRCFFASCHG